MSDQPTVTLGWNLPAPASWEELLELLEDVRQHVLRRDSWEGTITWSMPTDEAWLQDSDCGLVARYRVGNAEHGQGFLRAFTKDVPEEQVVSDMDPDRRSLAKLEERPGLTEASKLVEFLASLDTPLNEEPRKSITLQEIIDRAKACYRPR